MSVQVVEGELAEHLEVGALTVVETSDERLSEKMCVFVVFRHRQDASNMRYLRTCPTIGEGPYRTRRSGSLK